MTTTAKTNRRRRDEVYVGMVLEHKWRKTGTMVYNWTATIKAICPDSNVLKVDIMSQHGQNHSEQWNKLHTENGLKEFEYLEVK